MAAPIIDLSVPSSSQELHFLSVPLCLTESGVESTHMYTPTWFHIRPRSPVLRENSEDLSRWDTKVVKSKEVRCLAGGHGDPRALLYAASQGVLGPQALEY